MRKPAFCICENKDADQLRGSREADQRLCFRYKDSTIPLLPTYEASNHLVWSCSPVCVGPGRKPQRPVFSQRGSMIYVVNNKGTDQTAWMLRLICTFVVCTCIKQVFCFKYTIRGQILYEPRCEKTCLRGF